MTRRGKLVALAFVAIAAVPVVVLAADARARQRLAIRLELDVPEEAKVWTFSEERVPSSAKPLARLEDRLFAAEYSPSSDGCAVVAYDLDTRKELWRTQLRGLGPMLHSKYRNAVNLSVVEGVVVACAEESGGRYVECLSPRTGRVLYHRVLGPRDSR
jgi:hypothetical protein